jgi:uncharacterized membrane protein
VRNFRTDLIIILLLTIATDIVVGLSLPVPARVALGIPYLVFLPGYVLMAALFPRKEDLDGIERVALSFGLSIAVVPLVCLILNYTPWGIKLGPIIVSLTIFVAVMAAVAWARRQMLQDTERFALHVKMPSVGWNKMDLLDKTLTVVLVIAIGAALGSLVYVIAGPKKTEQFTEFYILGQGQTAQDYPNELAPGEEGRVTVGVINHEDAQVTYGLYARIDGKLLRIHLDGAERDEVRITLANGEKWQKEIGFVPQEASEQLQKVEFLLSKSNAEPQYERSFSTEVSDTEISLEISEQAGTVDITNIGNSTASYTVVVTQSGEQTQQQSLDISAGDNPKPSTVDFSVKSVKDTEVLIYKDDVLILTNSGASLSLHLWVTVAE